MNKKKNNFVNSIDTSLYIKPRDENKRKRKKRKKTTLNCQIGTFTIYNYFQLAIVENVLVKTDVDDNEDEEEKKKSIFGESLPK